jgi:DNA-binding MarR family transcriptional regulator
MNKLNEKKLEENLVNNQSYYGKGFIVIPRNLIVRICSDDDAERTKAWILLCLFHLSFFADGKVMLGDLSFECRRGEWIGTHRQLAKLSHIPSGNIARLLKQLAGQGLITLTRLPGGTRICLLDYDAYAAKGEEKARKKKEPEKSAFQCMLEGDAMYIKERREVNYSELEIY